MGARHAPFGLPTCLDTLGAINRFAYTELPDEVQLIWYRPT